MDALAVKIMAFWEWGESLFWIVLHKPAVRCDAGEDCWEHHMGLCGQRRWTQFRHTNALHMQQFSQTPPTPAKPHRARQNSDKKLDIVAWMAALYS